MKQIMIVMIVVFLSSCGSRPKKPITDVVNETESYVAQIRGDQNLGNTSSEGVLTDDTGFKDIGKYTLKTYYNPSNHEVLHIENVEKTDKIVAENFYYKKGQLVFVSTETNNDTPIKLHVYKNKVINQPKIDPEYQKILLDKARIYKKAYKKDE